MDIEFESNDKKLGIDSEVNYFGMIYSDEQFDYKQISYQTSLDEYYGDRPFRKVKPSEQLC